MINKIKELIRKMFGNEMAVSDSLHHDPFKGHTESGRTLGKSYFDTLPETAYVGYVPDDGFCNAGDGMPLNIQLRQVSEQLGEAVRIFVFEAIPTEIVYEGFGAKPLIRGAEPDEQKPLPVGYDVTTKHTCASWDIIVKRIHGSLQLVVPKNGCELVENETTKFTVVLTKESQGWAVASVHPGAPGEDVGKFLTDAGFKDGDRFYDLYLDDAEQRIPNPPQWLFDHLVAE